MHGDDSGKLGRCDSWKHHPLTHWLTQLGGEQLGKHFQHLHLLSVNVLTSSVSGHWSLLVRLATCHRNVKKWWLQVPWYHFEISGTDPSKFICEEWFMVQVEIQLCLKANITPTSWNLGLNLSYSRRREICLKIGTPQPPAPSSPPEERNYYLQ